MRERSDERRCMTGLIKQRIGADKGNKGCVVVHAIAMPMPVERNGRKRSDERMNEPDWNDESK